MDNRLLRYYDRELNHLQTVAAEFARQFPKVAGRLTLEDFPCADPYVERLLEGFAFLAARVQLKIDAEFPRFTQNLLESTYPHYLAPTPSMCVAQFLPDPAEAALADGYSVPRGTVMRSIQGRGDPTPCEYRTAHDVTLWPVEVEEAQYYTRDMATLELGSLAQVGAADAPGSRQQARAALRLRLRATANLTFNKTQMDTLPLFIDGPGATSGRVYEQLTARCRAVVVRAAPIPNVPRNKQPRWEHVLPGDAVRATGFAAAQALLPYDARSFQGYRLLQEYFAFPQRYLFVELSGLRPAMAKAEVSAIDVTFLFDAEDVELDGKVDAGTFRPHCTPAVNLFPKRADRIFVSDRATEFHVVADRTRPLDFEVHRVLRVTGFAAGGAEVEFLPFYAARDASADGSGERAYFGTFRQPRALSEREQQEGRRSRYTGSDVYVSLVDAAAAPFSPDIKQLAVETLCTNRDLPLQMPVGKGATDFTLQIAAPVKAVRVRAGPTSPRASHAEGDASWRLISHLSLNYATLLDLDERQGAGALRELLRLYADHSDASVRQQVEAVRSIGMRPIVRRAPGPGPITFARGLEVTLTVDEASFAGAGAMVFAHVMEQFFARYVSVNSFTETALRTVERGEVMRWAARVGDRPIF